MQEVCVKLEIQSFANYQVPPPTILKLPDELISNILRFCSPRLPASYSGVPANWALCAPAAQWNPISLRWTPGHNRLFCSFKTTSNCWSYSKKFCTCCPNLAKFSGTGIELQILPNLVNPRFSTITSKPQPWNPPSRHQNPGVPVITEPLNSHRTLPPWRCTSIAIFPHKSTYPLREFHDFLLPILHSKIQCQFCNGKVPA